MSDLVTRTDNSNGTTGLTVLTLNRADKASVFRPDTI